MFFSILLLILHTEASCTDLLGESTCILLAVQGACSGAQGASCRKSCDLCSPERSTCAGFEHCNLAEYVIEDAHCFGPTCYQEDDRENCCGLKKSCETFTNCTSDETLVRAELCARDTCDSLSDRASCCKAKVTCSQYGWCNTNVEYIVEDALCPGKTCLETDRDICCNARASCSLYGECRPDQYKAEENFCSTDQCNEIIDNVLCCGTLPSCAGYGGCSGTEVVRVDNTCANRNGCLENAEDKARCCAPRASCEGYTGCDADTQLVVPNKLCQAAECGPGDAQGCCIARAPCSSLECAGDAFSAPGALCAGATCTPQDQGTCCLPRQSCRDYQCDNDEAPDPVAFCAASPCTPDDKDRCCDNECTGFNCPSEKFVVTTAYCENSVCTTEDEAVCCAPRASCSTLTCPAGMYANAAAFCRAGACDAGDEEACCLQSPSCAGFAFCDSGRQIDVPASFCDGGECTDSAEDKATCCVDREACAAFAWCEETEVITADSFCNGAACTDSDADKLACCEPRASCETVNFCGENEYAVSGQYCAGSVCDAAVDAQCCNTKASCLHYEFCGHNEYVTNGKCAGNPCNWNDRAPCCADCNFRIYGVLQTADECPPEYGKCDMTVEVENFGENYFRIDRLGQFEWIICPGDKIQLSAHGYLQEDRSVLFLCTVANGERTYVFDNMVDVVIDCHSPNFVTAPAVGASTNPPVQPQPAPHHPCGHSVRHPEWDNWAGAEEVDWEAEECEHGEVELSHVDEDTYWTHVSRPYIPPGWSTFWFGDEAEYDDMKLNKARRPRRKQPRQVDVKMWRFVTLSFFCSVGLFIFCLVPCLMRESSDSYDEQLLHKLDPVSIE